MRRTADCRRTERNRLLLALPARQYARLAPSLQDVTLESGAILMRPGQKITHVYFPQQSVISLLTEVGDGSAVECALVGNDGVVGLPVFLGAHTAVEEAVSQIGDGARRLTVRAFQRALADGTALQRLLLRYAGTLMTQIAQCAACNQRHLVNERCARWLLMVRDRTSSDVFALTQEFLGSMLDVERTTASASARWLRDRGAIRYARGVVTIIDRHALERAACSCYLALQSNSPKPRRRGTQS